MRTHPSAWPFIVGGLVVAAAAPAAAHEHCPPEPAAQQRFTASIAAVERDYRAHLAQPIKAQTTAVYMGFGERLDRLDDGLGKAYGCNHLELAEMARLRDRISKLNAQIAVSRDEVSRDSARRRFEAEVVAQGWPADITREVLERKIRIGMTNAQVRMAWGKPERVYETVTGYGTREQWIYPGGTYLYFTNGQLETVQRSR